MSSTKSINSQDGRSRTVSERIAEEVASVAGVEPTALDPLYTVIDTDALNALFAARPSRPDGSELRVAFRYSGHEVVVGRDGSVDVSATGESVTESAASDF